jgi:hypothetical protein
MNRDSLMLRLKSVLRRPRSGLNENSPALQRWVTAQGFCGVREADD